MIEKLKTMTGNVANCLRRFVSLFDCDPPVVYANPLKASGPLMAQKIRFEEYACALELVSDLRKMMKKPRVDTDGLRIMKTTIELDGEPKTLCMSFGDEESATPVSAWTESLNG